MKKMIATTLLAAVCGMSIATSSTAEASPETTHEITGISPAVAVADGLMFQYSVDGRLLTGRSYESTRRIDITEGARTVLRVTFDANGGMVFSDSVHGRSFTQTQFEAEPSLMAYLDLGAVLAFHPALVPQVLGSDPDPSAAAFPWVAVGSAVAGFVYGACNFDGVDHCVPNVPLFPQDD